MAQAYFDPRTTPERPARTILVVDDEVLIRMTVSDHLRDCGFRVVEAATGDEAVKILGSDEPVDVVFSDIQMPGSLDGFGLAHWVRRHRPELRILLTSGIVRSAALAGDLCEQNNEPILSKPYDHQQLVRKLRKLVGEDDGNG